MFGRGIDVGFRMGNVFESESLGSNAYKSTYNEG